MELERSEESLLQINSRLLRSSQRRIGRNDKNACHSEWSLSGRKNLFYKLLIDCFVPRKDEWFGMTRTIILIQMINFHHFIQYTWEIYCQIYELTGMNVKNPTVNSQSSFSNSFLDSSSFDSIDTLFLDIEFY